MSNIRVDVSYTIQDGSELVFRSPVDCSAITGMLVYYPGSDGNITSKVFAFADAHGNNVGDIDHLFAENVVVKVILDVTTGMAFVQNADTNAYLEKALSEKAPATHLKDKSNPHGVTASQVGARPNTWTPTASEVGARPNTWMPTAAEVGAAPAGFGLGTHGATAKISAVGEIDNIKLNGKYMLLQNIGSTLVLEGIAFNFCGLEVSMADSHYGYQTIRFLEAGAIQRQLWKDVWQPWEWVNPPMEPGKEYRTTERYDGKPVYRKAYNVGNLPNSSYADVQYDITNLGRIISFRGSTSSNVALPNISTSAASTINLITAGTYFRITTATDRSNITAVVTLEYTKTTD